MCINVKHFLFMFPMRYQIKTQKQLALLLVYTVSLLLLFYQLRRSDTE